MLKPITLKVDEEQYRLLEEVSKATHIPKSALVRKGIDMILSQTKEDILSPELRREIDSLISQDRSLLKKLGEA